MEDKVPKKNKSKSQELVNSMILLECPEKDEPSEYIDHTCNHTCHNTLGNSTPDKYMIKIQI